MPYLTGELDRWVGIKTTAGSPVNASYLCSALVLQTVVTGSALCTELLFLMKNKL